MLYMRFLRIEKKTYTAAREWLTVSKGGPLRRQSEEKLARFQCEGVEGRRGFYQIHFKNGWFVQMTQETTGSTPKPHQKIDVYVQYPCFSPLPELCSSLTPAPFNFEIVLLCGWHNKLWSISCIHTSVRVCVWERETMSRASHIISAKYSVLAGTLQI